MGGEHHLVEQKLHERYGHVVRTGPNSLSFSGLADFDAIYGFNKSIEKSDFYQFGRHNPQTENIFSSRTDASHREHRRKVVGPALSAAKVVSYEPVISKNVSVLVSRLKALLEDRSAINVATIIYRYTFDTMVEIIFGAPICPQPWTDTEASTGVIDDFREVSKMAWACSLLPWFGWLMNTRFMTMLIRRPKYDAAGNMVGMQVLASRTRNMVMSQPEEAIKSTQPSIVKNYLSVPEDNSTHMSPDEIWRESTNLTFAGPGSTTAALTSILYRLGTPEGREWQSKIRDEHSPEPASLPVSSVLTAIIKETLRLHAPFPTAFPRIISPGAESAIPDLPAPLPVGTIVSAHTYILGHSKALWGEDVEVWRPERWLEAKDDNEKRELDEKFVAFSKGARGCIGKDIAMLVIARAVVSVLGVWEVRSLGEPKGNSWLEMQYKECMLEFTKLAE